MRLAFRTRLIGLYCAALVALPPPHRAVAYSFYQAAGMNIVWPGGQSVRYLSPSTFPEGSVTELLILEAMALWNVVPSTNFEYVYSRLDQDFPIDHFDGFNDTSAVAAQDLDPGVLGVTYLVNDGPVWFDMDVLFSDAPNGIGYTFDTNPTCGVLEAPTANGYSFLLIATHELGHALGLGHDPLGTEPSGTSWFVATMNPRYPSGGTIGSLNIVELHTDDRNGVRFLYPNSGPSEPPFRDLASAGFAAGTVVGKAVPLPVDPTTVFPGDELVVRSYIENFGNTHEFFVEQGFYLSTDELPDGGDAFLGALLWDLAFQDAFEFDVAIPLPEDLVAGVYHLIAVLDDLDAVPEIFEDNNAAVYCDPIMVAQLTPAIEPLAQFLIPCGQPFTGPSPVVTHPINMNPITWSLLGAPGGMTVNPSTGVISWPSPTPSPFLIVVTLRAENDAGAATQTLYFGVDRTAPGMSPIAMHSASCQPAYRGPIPQLTSTTCMSPILSWFLDTGPAGMIIDPSTGRVAWASPVPSSTTYNVTLRAINSAGAGTVSYLLRVIAGDVDGNAVVNLSDYRLMRPCLLGPQRTPGSGCTCSDTDRDADVDLRDFARFQNSHTN